jgi:hypothetical protein
MVVYFAIGSFFTYLTAIGIAIWLDHWQRKKNKQKTYEASNCNQGVD